MAPTQPSFNQQAAAADPSGAVRGMGDQTDCCALGPDSSSRHHCCWPTRTTTTTASRKELIVAPLKALIGFQARQGGPGLEQRLCCATSSTTTTTAGSRTELLSAESALPVGASGSRGSSASTRRLRVPRGGGGRRDAQYEEDDINSSGGGGVGGGILQSATTIDLIQIPALLAATTVVAGDADRSCNRISKADEATDHRLLFQTTNNVALEEEDMDTDTTERINNRTRITANTNTPPPPATATTTRGRPAKRTIDGVHYKLDSKLAPSRSKIRISHCNVSPTALCSREQVNRFSGQGSEELISNNVIKNGNHKYCYETRNSTRTMNKVTRKTVATPSRLLTAVVLFIMAHVNMVTVWADTSLGK